VLLPPVVVEAVVLSVAVWEYTDAWDATADDATDIAREAGRSTKCQGLKSQS